MAGIARDPDGPGFKRFDEVAVPADSEATLRAPAVSADSVREGGTRLAHVDGVSFLGHAEGRCPRTVCRLAGTA
jgi:hypothetical protein